jgi:Dna[CI] antecedent, DciA
MKQPKNAAQFISKAIANTRRGRKITARELNAYWELAAGTVFAKVSNAIALEKYILFVKVEDSKWKEHMESLKTELLNNWKTLPGRPVVKKIEFSILNRYVEE